MGDRWRAVACWEGRYVLMSLKEESEVVGRVREALAATERRNKTRRESEQGTVDGALCFIEDPVAPISMSDCKLILEMLEQRVRRHECFIVVIAREGVPEVTLFGDYESAFNFYDLWGSQWTESYIARVMRGPLV